MISNGLYYSTVCEKMKIDCQKNLFGLKIQLVSDQKRHKKKRPSLPRNGLFIVVRFLSGKLTL